MPSREEALRRILDVAAAGRLTEDQRRELAAHLDDSVEAKVAAGAAEIDAVAAALQDLGDLKKIARRFPEPAAPAAVTPEGWLWRAWGLESGYLLTLAFAGLVGFVGLQLERVFEAYKVAVPGLTLFFLDVGAGLRTHWPLAVPALLGFGWVVFRLRRTACPRAIGIALSLVSTALCAAAVVALTLPFLTLLEGVPRR